jgi:myosin heavy subunit
MDTQTMVDMKHEFDILTTKYLDEYMKLKTRYCQETSLHVEELTTIQSENKALCDKLKSNEQTIHSLEKEIERYQLREQELNHTITNIQQTNDETNKFDMLRGQAKEITAKDKEIQRLTKELEKVKELNSVKKNISVEIKENVGWSPTSSDAPIMDQTIDNDPISLDSETINTNKEEKLQEDTQKTKETKETQEKTIDTQKEDDESFYIITYRKQKYYRDSKNKVYEIMDDEDVGKCIGSWVKQPTGKFKLVKP